MKKLIYVVMMIFFMLPLIAETGTVPSSKRPKAIDKKKAEAAAAKDESAEDDEKNRNTVKYGMASEIGTLLDDLIKNDDPRYTEEIYDLFQATKNPSIKEKVLVYFTKLEDPCLEDFAVELLNDPFDEQTAVVKATFSYVAAVKTKEAIPPVKTMIEQENEVYFNDAITTMGEIGGADEALFLAEFLDRDDLDTSQRQTIMRVCGKMHAIETWGRLVDIIEDEDENTFVRMYAAESIGLMEDERSIPVLERNFGATDPNLRQYIIKGISHFPKSKEAQNVILQGIRDDHWKVRQEAIKSAKEMDLKDAIPFLIYRAKNDSEKVIKDEAFVSIGALNTKEGNEFLISQLTDKKASDSNKTKAVEVLLKQEKGNGDKEIVELAEKTLEDDKLKKLRYAIGKEIAKYDKAVFADVCIKYLSSKDNTTVSLGLDMYKTAKYSSARDGVMAIAMDKKGNASNRNRAIKLLGLDEDDLKDQEKSN